jgi:ubiquinone/menaquinone biosynthesis C-methylase UbiE
VGPFGWIVLALLGLLLGAAAYYLLWLTEGMYLGWRVVAALYDWYASRYDRTKAYDLTYENFFVARPIVQRMFDDGAPAPLILDVATGTGRVPRLLVDQDDFHGRVIGLDSSRKMLFHAAVKLHGARRAHLVWGTVAGLPFDDATFDMVTCIEAWEFFPAAKHDLRELVRVLRPGGTLLLTNRAGAEARIMPGKTLTHAELRAWLVDELGLLDVDAERWQVDYDLFWARKPGGLVPAGPRPLAEILRCPVCGALEMAETDAQQWVCLACEARASVGEDGVIELMPLWEAARH